MKKATKKSVIRLEKKVDSIKKKVHKLNFQVKYLFERLDDPKPKRNIIRRACRYLFGR